MIQPAADLTSSDRTLSLSNMPLALTTRVEELQLHQQQKKKIKNEEEKQIYCPEAGKHTKKAKHPSLSQK